MFEAPMQMQINQNENGFVKVGAATLGDIDSLSSDDDGAPSDDSLDEMLKARWFGGRGTRHGNELNSSNESCESMPCRIKPRRLKVLTGDLNHQVCRELESQEFVVVADAQDEKKGTLTH
jgi:hypothetical protein